MLPSELSRVMFYARFVKKLEVYNTGPRLIGYFLVLLAKALQGRILLLNIEYLIWNPDDDYEFPFIHAFLGPNIRRLIISLTGMGGYAASSRLSDTYKWNLPETYPSLVSFQMDDYDYDYDYHANPAIITTASHMICGWAHLQVVAVNNLTPAAFEYLASLPSLRELSLSDIRDISPLPDPAPTPESGLFPALQGLVVTYNRPDIGIALLQTVTCAPLVRLSITCPCDAEHGRHLLKTLLTCRAAYNSLQSLAIYSSERPYLSTFIESDITPAALSTESLRNVFAFTNLLDVELEIAGGFDMDDAELEEMARAWRRLECLSLRTRAADPGQHSRLTLRALVILARECQALVVLDIEYLDATMDALNVARVFAGGRPMVNKHVQSINIRHSPIDDIQQVSLFLRTIFTGLEVIAGTSWRREMSGMDQATNSEDS
ncbi:hypothetical protein Hypma_001350 [Hypsizygus marmoreus]|uniref:F-box domain-containing protein n=1 Tax=Hypsizygus marmoreus TaxID=39966 RepID=A0A369K8P0_HYPMA|nr:hypothetical protein Hypma_001350 [Hypsizygus marmoreus]